MSTTQRKRNRANTKGEATDTNEVVNSPATIIIPDVDYQSMIDTFNQATIKALLFNATKQSLAVANAVILHHQQIVAAEAERIIDFDCHSKSTGVPLPMPIS